MLELQELRKIGQKELAKELATARKKLVQARNNLKTNQDKKSHMVKAYKKYIAQIHTVEKSTPKK
ncbi:MAG: hypothetical protein ACD_51C00283G0020 [uncultured bacterium]|nr:MAG: hypothetical protein ACD_51C00283G0020 [uncultured bacterium]OGJ47970.1 MAG: 50S ribosomal protein L29 [Candidatus Peregrinibacteria bacterium RIFOXYB12_FULL_41_12]OGJ48486.1 MAG: 50S ribosomal protein L29 [Candidatus Peregrinibacteria bacterium RIFOXYA2_FULL_41_18]OGJ52515.1 MAG: 50S ribosomal protein L29 [Candidatus Peregrinibacteria bacterium RIFOXYC2_FULL_41_22]OGJ55376.1 MAG: 50S ribosomal protein L29 [Candidatus Peregrinibacteria bacterium RIFOXYB2_FULL_41_88]